MTSVRIECPCPPADGGTRHPDGDTVTLRESLGLREAIAIRNAVIAAQQNDPLMPEQDYIGLLAEQYVGYGVEAWTLEDADGVPIEVTRPALVRFYAEHPVEAVTVADAADGLYTSKVVLPLLKRAFGWSPATPTEPSTSAPSGSSETPSAPTPSKPSSTSTSPTDGTETTSPSLAGASS